MHPPLRRSRHPGGLPHDDRASLAGTLAGTLVGTLVGIVRVLIIGCTRAQAPTDQLSCSGGTCWRRVPDWTQAGVWPGPHQSLLDEPHAAGKLQVETAVAHGSGARPCDTRGDSGTSPGNRSGSGCKRITGHLPRVGEPSTQVAARSPWR